MLGVRAAKGLSRQFQVGLVTNLIKQAGNYHRTTLLLGSSLVRVVTSWVQIPVGPFAFSSPVTFDTHDLRLTMLPPTTSKPRFIFYICTIMFSLFYQNASVFCNFL